MKIDSHRLDISLNNNSLFFDGIFFESFIFIFSSYFIFFKSNETPAITNGPNTDPLPASSMPPKINNTS